LWHIVYHRSADGKLCLTESHIMNPDSIVGYYRLSVLILTTSFLADRTNGRAIGTVLRLSSSVCDVMYCG